MFLGSERTLEVSWPGPGPGSGRVQLLLLSQALLGVIDGADVSDVGLQHLGAAGASLRDGVQGAGALRAEGGRGGQVLGNTGAGGEGGVGRVPLAVQVVDAVRPAAQKAD